MLGRPIVVTATPTGAHWHVGIPGHRRIATRTLVMAEAMAARRVTGAFDLQVGLGGLEDLCADAVELGQAPDAAHIAALKARRVVVRTLKDAGYKPVDVGYLTGIPTETVDNLLTVPVETPLMTTGSTPWRRHPHLQDPPPAGGTRQVVAATVTPAGSSWDLHLAGDMPPQRVRTLAAAENALTTAAGDGGVDVYLIPQLPETCQRHIDDADTADELNERCYLLRLQVARRCVRSSSATAISATSSACTSIASGSSWPTPPASRTGSGPSAGWRVSGGGVELVDHLSADPPSSRDRDAARVGPGADSSRVNTRVRRRVGAARGRQTSTDLDVVAQEPAQAPPR